RPLNPPPAAKEIKINITKCGTLRNKSISHVTMVSHVLFHDASKLKQSARSVLRNEANTPTPRLNVKPFNVLASISRPSQSVPNKWAREGGSFFKSRWSPALDG